MSRGRQAQAIKLSRVDRKSLELLTRRSTAEHRQVVRAQIALMCHAGQIYDGLDRFTKAATRRTMRVTFADDDRVEFNTGEEIDSRGGFCLRLTLLQ